jgi:hypothetical protein
MQPAQPHVQSQPHINYSLQPYIKENEMRIHLENEIDVTLSQSSECSGEIQCEIHKNIWHCSNPSSPALVSTAAHKQAADKKRLGAANSPSSSQSRNEPQQPPQQQRHT